MLNLAYKSFKSAILNMFKELKEIMFKEFKDNFDNNDLSNREYQ